MPDCDGAKLNGDGSAARVDAPDGRGFGGMPADEGRVGGLAALWVSCLDLDLSIEPKREERRDLKLGLDSSFESLGLCIRW